MTVRIGETFIHGRGREQAQAVLTAAAAVGVEPRRVRATDTGFIVPNEVADELGRTTNVPAWSGPDAVF